MKPTVGRLVHYTSLGDRDGKYPAETQAAMITRVTRAAAAAELIDTPFETGYHVSLRVFYEDGDFNMKQVPFTSAKAGTETARGKWCWPERL